jgi:hydrogenase expression/formation protein HypC
MCLAIPARIVELLDGDACRVELGGVRMEISLALVDGAAVGDYVIVHVGYALTRLDPDEAARTLALFAEAGLGGLSDAALAPGGEAPFDGVGRDDAAHPGDETEHVRPDHAGRDVGQTGGAACGGTAIAPAQPGGDRLS